MSTIEIYLTGALPGTAYDVARPAPVAAYRGVCKSRLRRVGRLRPKHGDGVRRAPSFPFALVIGLGRFHRTAADQAA